MLSFLYKGLIKSLVKYTGCNYRNHYVMPTRLILCCDPCCCKNKECFGNIYFLGAECLSADY